MKNQENILMWTYSIDATPKYGESDIAIRTYEFIISSDKELNKYKDN